ncbi:MAG: vitamin K epoxide reductase family protein [Acidimicrobiales bacterium]
MPTLRWQPITTLVLSLFGLGVSIYLTITHFSPHALVCVSNSTFNCEKVTTSPQSEVFGIPVAILGLFYFVPMIALCLPASWRSTDRRIHLARLALSIVGVGMILYLIIAEFFIIKAICLWCSSVHLTTFILFVIIVTSSPAVLAPGFGADPTEGHDESYEGA